MSIIDQNIEGLTGFPHVFLMFTTRTTPCAANCTLEWECEGFVRTSSFRAISYSFCSLDPLLHTQIIRMLPIRGRRSRQTGPSCIEPGRGRLLPRPDWIY